jgi:hypothetical protein
MNNSLPTISEDQTPEPGSSANDSNLSGAPIADISDQLESGETLSETSEQSSVTPIEQPNINVPVDEGSNIPLENPPFIAAAPIKSETIIPEKKVPNELGKVINFRKTLKHKKRYAYEILSDSEKIEAKKKIVNNLIDVLRASTHKSTYNAHKKSIVKLRHTFNKHLDYLETKKRVKTEKKFKKSSNNISNNGKSKR